MSQILPFKSEVEVSRDSPRVVTLDGDDSEAIFNALASETSREIYRALYQDPATASEVAEKVDTSVQNVRYHLEKLQEAGLIDQVDTWYSSRGNEMSVYAASNEALIVAGDKHRSSELRSLFKSSAGAMAVLAGASVLLHWMAIELYTETMQPVSDQTRDQVGIAMVPEAIDVVNFPPGVLAFLGGFIILAVFTALSYRRIQDKFDS